MGLVNSIINQHSKKRLKEIEYFKTHPFEVQDKGLKTLINTAKDTVFGKQYDFANIKNFDDFYKKVPISDYDKLKPFIEREIEGEENVLYGTATKWFAKSSGTTSDRSKYIPITKESLSKFHYQSGMDIYYIFIQLFPDSKIFTKKALSIGGSTSLTKNGKYYIGDLSAIIIKNLPLWTGINRCLDKTTALIPEWDKKLEKIVEISKKQDVAQLIGVPSWLLVLLKKLLDATGKNNILEFWPNLELFIHGGVNFVPYKDIYHELIPSESMNYLETYNASEGFFAIQDEFYKNRNDMLLMLDYEIFYEFIEISDFHAGRMTVIPLSGVKTDTIYAMLISTNGGLWRYIIGDTVKFTSTNPYKIIISGRTAHYINLFGEELMVNNTDNAIYYACTKTNAKIKDYTAAPLLYKNEKSQGTHEWLLEFIDEPLDIQLFMKFLDDKLCELNSDYDAKRFKNINLDFPKYTIIPKNTFSDYLKNNNKIGGQNKIPRLSNDRKFLEKILNFIQEKNNL